MKFLFLIGEFSCLSSLTLVKSLAIIAWDTSTSIVLLCDALFSVICFSKEHLIEIQHKQESAEEWLLEDLILLQVIRSFLQPRCKKATASVSSAVLARTLNSGIVFSEWTGI